MVPCTLCMKKKKKTAICLVILLSVKHGIPILVVFYRIVFRFGETVFITLPVPYKDIMFRFVAVIARVIVKCSVSMDRLFVCSDPYVNVTLYAPKRSGRPKKKYGTVVTKTRKRVSL